MWAMPVQACPDYGHECAKCSKLNQFANSYGIKTRDSDSSDESLYCYNITKIEGEGARTTRHTRTNGMKQSRFKIRHKVKLDTRAQVQYKMFRKVNQQFQVQITKVKLRMLDGIVKPIGKVRLNCKCRDSEAYIDLILVDLEVMPLLGLSGCIALNLVKRVISIATEGKEQFKDKVIKPEAEPVSRPPRRVPVALRNRLKDELDQREYDIDERAWIRNLVIAKKCNGNIRLCLDPSYLNAGILRECHVVPKVSDIRIKLAGNKFFRTRFRQIPLDEESFLKCCFSSPYGKYKYLRLPYGTSNAPELFQNLVEHNFAGIPNITIYYDDIMCMGETGQINDDTVRKAVERNRESNIKFNKEKLQYKLSAVTCAGHRFSADGMRVDPDRTRSLTELEPPSSKKQLQRIIGTFIYGRCFVPHMANTLAPLCDLLKAGVVPAGSPKSIRHTQTENMYCTHPNLIQTHITDHTTTENEMLPTQFAVCKFHDYVYGAEVSVQTDNKPLVSIMKKCVAFNICDSNSSNTYLMFIMSQAKTYILQTRCLVLT
ncbi:hypothetical protein PR048_013889 [Dryococelus australis]|uniref:Reverse transcriptase domain-containing protein n=1 Tax=Dryococelus australis TaxID=614101 RepID=A0ABQ9HTG5_9NEOP|nr:hypothetical protein PR048_013889 [Dryococelus australis]